MQVIDCEIPDSIKNKVKSLNPSCWLKRHCSRYRKCSSLHFGLGIPRSLQRNFYFGQFSHRMPELQQGLLDFIRSISDLEFSSIILNKYEPGDRMGEHIDWNTSAIQLSARFGNATGAELRIGNLKFGSGVFLMDTNVPHEVLVCKSGVMYKSVCFSPSLFLGISFEISLCDFAFLH